MFAKSEKVSVVIRTRCRPASLCQAVESVLCQTWENIEIIIVNDGMPLDFINIFTNDYAIVQLRDLMEKGRLKIISTESNGNRSHAANIGWKSSTGDMVLFLDDDDLLLRNHVAGLISCLHKNPWCSIAFSGALRENCHGKRIPLEMHEIDLPSLVKENLFPLHCALVQRSALEAVSGFDEAIDMFEDWELWLHLLLAGFEFAGVKQWSAVYRIHGTGTIKSNPFGSAKDINSRWNVIIKHEAEIRKQLAAAREISRLRTLISVVLFKIMKRLL